MGDHREQRFGGPAGVLWGTFPMSEQGSAGEFLQSYLGYRHDAPTHTHLLRAGPSGINDAAHGTSIVLQRCSPGVTVFVDFTVGAHRPASRILQEFKWFLGHHPRAYRPP